MERTCRALSFLANVQTSSFLLRRAHTISAFCSIVPPSICRCPLHNWWSRKPYLSKKILCSHYRLNRRQKHQSSSRNLFVCICNCTALKRQEQRGQRHDGGGPRASLSGCGSSRERVQAKISGQTPPHLFHIKKLESLIARRKRYFSALRSYFIAYYLGHIQIFGSV